MPAAASAATRAREKRPSMSSCRAAEGAPPQNGHAASTPTCRLHCPQGTNIHGIMSRAPGRVTGGRTRYTSLVHELVEALCSDACAGRAPGTPGGDEARRLVREAMRGAGLEAIEQAVPAAGGGNVLATIRGDVDRYVLVAAHFDHLGQLGGETYRGADDNAAAVAILVEVGKQLAAKRADGRGVILAAFDAEEPPHFMQGSMGSEFFARHPWVPLERIDLMVCMDLVGHALGDASLPGSVRETLFALGAERSEGTSARLDAIAEPGVIVRRADAEIIPPLSDYGPFWARERPFVFLTSGRTRRYHTPSDTPEHLDWAKMSATARWLERFVRDACARDSSYEFRARRDDVGTLDSLIALLSGLSDARADPRAEMVLEMARGLRAQCRADGALPSAQQGQIAILVGGIESALA